MNNSYPAYRCYDIPDETWTLLEPYPAGRKGVWEGIAQNRRLFINVVFWTLRTGAVAIKT